MALETSERVINRMTKEPKFTIIIWKIIDDREKQRLIGRVENEEIKPNIKRHYKSPSKEEFSDNVNQDPIYIYI